MVKFSSKETIDLACYKTDMVIIWAKFFNDFEISKQLILKFFSVFHGRVLFSEIKIWFTSNRSNHIYFNIIYKYASIIVFNTLHICVNQK